MIWARNGVFNMQIQMTLKVSAQEFYDFVVSSIQASLEMADSSSDKEVKEGTSYKTSMKTTSKQQEKTKVKVTHLKEPEHIRTTYSSASISSATEYKIQPIDDQKCVVTYVESNFDPHHKELEFQGLKKMILERKLKKRLHDVEAYLIKKRNQPEES